MADIKFSTLPSATPGAAASLVVLEAGANKLKFLTVAGAALVEAATVAAQRTALGLGTAALAAVGDFDAAGTAASEAAAAQAAAELTASGDATAKANAAYAAAVAAAAGDATTKANAAQAAAIATAAGDATTKANAAQAAAIASSNGYTDAAFTSHQASISARSRVSIIEYLLNYSSTTDSFEGNLHVTMSGSGTAVAVVTGAANAAGVVSLSAGTTNTGRCALATALTALLLGGGPTRFFTRVAIPTLSDVSQTFTVISGFADVITAIPQTDGVYFSYTDSLNGGRWQATCVVAGVPTNLDTGVMVVAGAWYTLEAVVNAAGSSVEFFINGVSVGTITTNIPSAPTAQVGFVPAFIAKTVGTAARLVNIDTYALDITYTTPV